MPALKSPFGNNGVAAHAEAGKAMLKIRSRVGQMDGRILIGLEVKSVYGSRQAMAVRYASHDG